MNLSARRRCVVFGEAASSHPSSVRTAMLVFTRVWGRPRRPDFLVTPAVAWISANVRGQSYTITGTAKDPFKPDSSPVPFEFDYTCQTMQ
jgi:hypothetical protein